MNISKNGHYRHYAYFIPVTTFLSQAAFKFFLEFTLRSLSVPMLPIFVMGLAISASVWFLMYKIVKNRFSAIEWIQSSSRKIKAVYYTYMTISFFYFLLANIISDLLGKSGNQYNPLPVFVTLGGWFVFDRMLVTWARQKFTHLTDGRDAAIINSEDLKLPPPLPKECFQ